MNAWSRIGETRFIYDGMLAVQERDSNNVVKVTYTRGIDLSSGHQGAGGIGGLLARTDSSTTAFYHSDGAGNITGLIDSNQHMVARYLYDAYGRQLGQWGSLAEANRYRFSSKEWHANSGLYYYGYRFYEPNFQRWLNRDPIGESGGINLYRFIRNNPVNSIDALGESENNRVDKASCPLPKPPQWHHPIPWDNSAYDFANHDLVRAAGWTKSDLKNKQKAILLYDHAGPHSKPYLDAVQNGLDNALEDVKLRGQLGNPAESERALTQLVGEITDDVRNGVIDPYNPAKTRPVPGIDPVPYGQRPRCKAPSGLEPSPGIGNRINGTLNGIAPWFDLWNLFQMLFRPRYEYWMEDGTIRDDRGNVIGAWQA